jgi:hypothetical protein
LLAFVLGGLIFNKNLSSGAPALNVNDCLRLGSTFHGLHAIATQVSPVVTSGIEKIETSTFKLRCFQSLTGVKFVVTASVGSTDLESLLQGIYEIYSDYVLKVTQLLALQIDIFHVHTCARSPIFNRLLLALSIKRVSCLYSRENKGIVLHSRSIS